MEFRPNGIGLWELDADLRTTDANVALTRALLVAREDLIGRPATDLVEDLSHARFDAAIRDAGRGRIHQVVLRTGEEAEFYAGIVAEKKSGGGYVLAVVDMSSFHDELRLTELRGNAIMNSLIAGVVVTDEHGRIERVNPAAEYIFGREFMEMIGQPIGILMPEDDRVRHTGYLGRYLDSRDTSLLSNMREVRGLRANGTTFQMEISVSEVSEGDHTIFVAICRDLTDKKAIEAQIAQREADIVKLYRALMKAQEAQPKAPAPPPTPAPAPKAAAKPAPAPEPPPPPPPAAPVPAPYKLLLIGKDKPLISQTRKLAEQAGFGIIHAESGRQALGDIGTIRPHVVFVCFYTSDMQGQVVGKFMAGTEEAKGVPIVLLVPPSLKGTSDFKAFGAFKAVLEFPVSDAELLKTLETFRDSIKL